MWGRVLRSFSPRPTNDPYWRDRDQNNNASIKGYWDTRGHGLRKELRQAIESLGVKSVFEPGAHCGVNLAVLADNADYERLAGSDISPHVVEAGRELLKNYDIELGEGTASNIDQPDNSFDVVLTSGLLVCIGEGEIEDVLREIVRVSRKYIILVEPKWSSRRPLKEKHSLVTYYSRDYERMLSKMGLADFYEAKYLREENSIGHMNSIQIFVKESGDGHVK